MRVTADELNAIKRTKHWG